MLHDPYCRRMDIRLLTSPDDLRLYNAWIKTHPDGTLWQSLEWNQFQESLGRTVRIYAAIEDGKILASAMVVIDKTSLGLSTWEIPRGPVVSSQLSVISTLYKKIIEDARKNRCMQIYCSPHTSLTTDHCHLTTSRRHIFPEATRILDVTLDDDALLAQMKPKGRYNIRLAQKHGVRVEQSDDVQIYAQLAEKTARRDGFRGHTESFYRQFLKELPGSFFLLASTEDHKPIAGLLGVVWGKAGIYYYGASGNAHRELMAPYLLQWEALRLCRERGCASYDLFGIAPEGKADHPWSSVSEFKAKFGGTVVTYPPEQEILLRPHVNSLLKVKRRILG